MPPKSLSIITECDSNTLKGKIKTPNVYSAKVLILNSASSIVDTKEARNGEFFIKNFNLYKKIIVSAEGFTPLLQDIKCDSKTVKKDIKSKDTRSKTNIKPSVKIIGKLEGRMPNQYIVGFDVCAGSNQIGRAHV